MTGKTKELQTAKGEGPKDRPELVVAMTMTTEAEVQAKEEDGSVVDKDTMAAVAKMSASSSTASLP